MPSFFLNDTAPTEIYPLSLHDVLPISRARGGAALRPPAVSPQARGAPDHPGGLMATLLSTEDKPRRDRRRGGDRWRSEERGHQTSRIDRKSTRLNSSHVRISYAVFFFK